jgi:magnesium transporter
MQSISHKKFSWVLIEDPKAEDISFVQDEFKLHPLIIGKLTIPLYRPQFSQHDGYTFLVVHYPLFTKTGRFREMGEIDILMNDKFVVTVCGNDESPISHFFIRCQKNIEASKKYFQNGPYYLLLILIAQLLQSYFPFLDHLAEETDQLENDLFNEKENKTLKDITLLQRDILDVRRVIKPQLPILRSVFNEDDVKKNKYLDLYAQDIVATNIQIWNTLENFWETVQALHRTNNTLISYKLNKILNILTAFWASFMPATLIASIFGMNVQIPITDFRMVLIIMFLAMGVTAFSLFLLMKRKG